MPISSASISAPNGRPRHSASISQPIAAAPPTNATTARMPRSRRARSVRCGRLSLWSKNAIARPASTTGCGTNRNNVRISPNSASIAKPTSSSSSGSLRDGGLIAAAISAATPRQSIGRDQSGAIIRGESGDERTGCAAVRPRQPRPRGHRRVRAGRGGAARPAPGPRFRKRLSRIRPPDDRRSAR